VRSFLAASGAGLRSGLRLFAPGPRPLGTGERRCWPARGEVRVAGAGERSLPALAAPWPPAVRRQRRALGSWGGRGCSSQRRTLRPGPQPQQGGRCSLPGPLAHPTSGQPALCRAGGSKGKAGARARAAQPVALSSSSWRSGSTASPQFPAPSSPAAAGAAPTPLRPPPLCPLAAPTGLQPLGEGVQVHVVVLLLGSGAAARGGVPTRQRVVAGGGGGVHRRPHLPEPPRGGLLLARLLLLLALRLGPALGLFEGGWVQPLDNWRGGSIFPSPPPPTLLPAPLVTSSPSAEPACGACSR
jgi:hypothetical protein